MHDHTEHTVTNNGISPGGDITAIVYQGFKTKDGLPRVATSLKKFFDPDYYRGNVPVFDPRIFHSTQDGYRYGWPETGAKGKKPTYPVRRPRGAIQKRKDPLEGHTIAVEYDRGTMPVSRTDLRQSSCLRKFLAYAQTGDRRILKNHFGIEHAYVLLPRQCAARPPKRSREREQRDLFSLACNPRNRHQQRIPTCLVRAGKASKGGTRRYRSKPANRPSRSPTGSIRGPATSVICTWILAVFSLQEVIKPGVS